MRLRFKKCTAPLCSGGHFENGNSGTTPIPYVGHPDWASFSLPQWTSDELKVGWWRFAIARTGNRLFGTYSRGSYSTIVWNRSEIASPTTSESVRDPIHFPTSKLYLVRGEETVKTLQLNWYDVSDFDAGGADGPAFGVYYAFAYVEKAGTRLRAEYDKLADPQNKLLQPGGFFYDFAQYYPEAGSPDNFFRVIGDLVEGCANNPPLFGHGREFPEIYGFPWRNPTGFGNYTPGYPYI